MLSEGINLAVLVLVQLNPRLEMNREEPSAHTLLDL